MSSRSGKPRNLSQDSFRVNRSGGDVKLFAKYNNKWHSTNLSENFKIINQHIHPTQKGIVSYNSKDEGLVNTRITADSSSAPILKLLHDSTNYASITTTANGATTIETTDSDGVLGNLILVPNGKVIIDKDLNSTSAAATTALMIDYDRIGAVTSGVDASAGIDLDMNVNKPGNANPGGGNPNDGFADYYMNIFGDVKKIINCQIINSAKAYSLETGDIIQFSNTAGEMPVDPFGDNWADYYMITNLQRSPGSVSITAREVG